jgi:hypothetical protein
MGTPESPPLPLPEPLPDEDPLEPPELPPDDDPLEPPELLPDDEPLEPPEPPPEDDPPELPESVVVDASGAGSLPPLELPQAISRPRTVEITTCRGAMSRS